MFDNFAVVIEVVSDTKLKVLSIRDVKEIIVQASKGYVDSIKRALNYEDGETIIIEYDLDTKIINEDIDLELDF